MDRRPTVKVPADPRPPIYDSALEGLAETSGEIVRVDDLSDYEISIPRQLWNDARRITEIANMPAEVTIGHTILRLVTGDIADQDTDAVVTAAHWPRTARSTRKAGQAYTRSAAKSAAVQSETR